jgi:hypothetical protein
MLTDIDCVNVVVVIVIIIRFLPRDRVVRRLHISAGQSHVFARCRIWFCQSRRLCNG